MIFLSPLNGPVAKRAGSINRFDRQLQGRVLPSVVSQTIVVGLQTETSGYIVHIVLSDIKYDHRTGHFDLGLPIQLQRKPQMPATGQFFGEDPRCATKMYRFTLYQANNCFRQERYKNYVSSWFLVYYS